MTSKIVPVILAGGRGTRLWPLSRVSAPKQFIQFVGERTLFQETLARVSDPALYEPPIVVTNEEFRFLVAEQARQMEVALAAMLLEPVARNTAPAIAAAACHVASLFGADTIMQVLASDHEIAAGTHYFDCIRTARETAREGRFVTFGIRPTEPATGYGYIEIGAALATGAHAVSRFVEKPRRDVAQEMLASGGFVWNSGIFMLPVAGFLAELDLFAPEVARAAEAAQCLASRDLDFVRLDAEAFAKSPDISIDYAVMEKTENAAVVVSSFAWSDLGSWDQVWKTGERDAHGNLSSANTTLVDMKNSLVMSQGAHLAVQGLENVVVIASEDAVYIGPMKDSQSVGALVGRLGSRPETLALTQTHPTSYRPWGSYSAILDGERFQVKRLTVLPGKKLSLQMHHRRAEHWVVVRGTAEVTIGDDTRMLQENESVHIPIGQVHRLSNPGRITLEVIEVQTGSYFGADDIIRLEDEFGRQ